MILIRRRLRYIISAYLIFTLFVVPFLIYYSLWVEKNIYVKIKRQFNSYRAHQALQLVESSSLFKNLATNITFVCNETLYKYLEKAKEAPPDDIYHISYYAKALEGHIHLKLEEMNNTKNITLYHIVAIIDNETFINMSLPLDMSFSGQYIFLNDSFTNQTYTNASLELDGVIIRSDLTYFITSKFYPLCGAGNEYHQVVLVDESFSLVFIVVFRLEMVS